MMRFFLFLVLLNAVNTLWAYDNVFLNTRYHEVSVMLLDDFTWVQPQFKGALFKTNNPPSKVINGIKIISKQPIINASETLLGIDLQVNKVNDHYEINVPDFIYISSINFLYLTNESLDELSILPKWLYNNRISAFAHITNRELGTRAEAYTQVEKKLKNMGFSNYVRNVKSHDRSKQTLWNSHAVISSNGKIAYKNREDFVRRMASNAKDNELHFIAYYKDTGDQEVLKAHPEWECKNVKGKSVHRVFTFLDFYSDYKEIVLKQLKELAERGAEAIYFDYIHLPAKGCFGSEIEKLFIKETNLKVPNSIRHKNFSKYIVFQSRVLNDVFKYWKQELQKEYPSVFFIISTAYISGLTSQSQSSELAEISDIVKLEFETGRRGGVRGNVFKKTSTLAKPTDRLLMTLALTLPRDLSAGMMSHIWTNKLANEYHLQGFVSAAIAMGGVAAIHIDNQYLKNDSSLNDYDNINRVMTPYNSFAPAIELGAILSKTINVKMPYKYAAVLFSDQLRNKYGSDYENAWRNVIWPSVGAYYGFLKGGVAVNVISDNKLLTDLSKYKVIFLPQPESELSIISRTAIDKFKENNGTVIYNQPDNWQWDNPSFNEQANIDFRIHINSQIKEAPLRVMLNNNSIYPFMYVKDMGNYNMYNFFNGW